MEEANFCKLIKKRTCHIEGEDEKVEFISNTEVQPSTAVNLSPKLRNAAKREQVKEADTEPNCKKGNNIGRKKHYKKKYTNHKENITKKEEKKEKKRGNSNFRIM